jgi:small-conductance mechanosensitive channel
MFNNLGGHLLLFVGFLGAYSLLRYYFFELRGAIRVSSYLGLLTIISGAVVILKTWRIIVLEYLFFGHMRSGVPVLIVNISSLLVSILMGGWIVAEVFEVQLVPLLATSAIFSIILGLALQDTLGNLFAGIALQFDKPYEIGDWIEVNTGSQVIIGQVQEISWRAAVLTALTDESLTIPNRILAQSKISNYSLKTRPIIRSQIFRIDPTSDINLCKSLLLQAASRVTRIRQSPAPMVLITETHESWLPYKLIYFIDDFGSQWMVSDEIITSSVAELQRQGIKLAPAKIRLDSPLA